MENPIVSVRGLTKTYGRGDARVHALRGVDLDIPRGQFTAVMGPSGSGKSTLMHCVVGLESADSGRVEIDGKVVSDMSQRQLTRLRRDSIGFIFQSFNLIPTLSAEENICLPSRIGKREIDRERFTAIVTAMGLADRLEHRPVELSGGQQQRVAVARALLSSPDVVFADEPTGNLDSTASEQVLDFIRASVDDFGQTVVMVTHEPDAAAYADRVIFLADGQLTFELYEPTRDSVLDALRAA